MEIMYWDSLKNKNLDEYTGLWHKDVIAWPHYAKSPVGKEGVVNSVIPWIQFITSYNLNPQAINLFGNFAATYYRYKLKCDIHIRHRLVPIPMSSNIYRKAILENRFFLTEGIF